MSREVPLGWQEAQLSDIAFHITEKWEPSDGEELPYIGLEHLGQGTGTILEVGSSSGLSSIKTRFNNGDVLFGKLRPNLRKTAHVTFSGVASTDIIILRPKQTIDPKFLFYTLNTAPCFEHAIRSAAGTKMPRTSWDLMGGYVVALPPLSEQRRIAEILSSVDEAIQATQAVVEQTRKVKQGVLERLLTRGMGDPRFKQTEIGELPENWRVVRVGDVVVAKGGKRMPKGRPFANHATPYPYVRVSDFKNGTISRENLAYVLPEDRIQIANYTISSSDVYISIAGTIGVSGTVPKDLNGAQLTENAAKLVIKSCDELSPEYLALCMTGNLMQRQIVSAKGVGGGVPKLALFRIEQMLLPLPPLEEQGDITGCLQSFDQASAAQENSLTRARALKSSLSTDLLTGRKRVSTDLLMAAE